MKWKKKEATSKPKHSITSTSSMSFLTDENLTFHRFSDGTVSFDSVRKKSEVTSYVDDIIPDMMQQKKPRLILREVSNASSFGRINEESPTTADTTPYGVWTTHGSLNSYTNGAALNLSDETSTSTFGRSVGGAVMPHSSTMLANGSTMKLINTSGMGMEMYDDQSSKQLRFQDEGVAFGRALLKVVFDPEEPRSPILTLNREIRSTILIFSAVVVFEGCWVPVIVLNVWEEIHYEKLTLNMLAVFYTIARLSSVVNPLLYALHIRENRAIIARCCCLSREPPNTNLGH